MTENLRMPRLLRGFLKREDGAVTVDWIVLTAALVLMAIGAAAYVRSSVAAIADGTAQHIGGQSADGNSL